ncbi:MAG: hypothetical protein NT007_18375 [Candidatus Kapabacteria bacterium]|nr:hypothetical protein [Candidatus Kapabacteria bacterium]
MEFFQKFTKNKILPIIAFTLALRIIFVWIYFDFSSESNYLEYGNIAKNIVAGKGFSLFYLNQDKIEFNASENSKPVPSAYMPPAYLAVILPFFTIKSIILRNIALLIFNILLSLFSVYLIFRVTNHAFNERVALLSAILYSIFPDFIYIVATIGPTLIYHILILLLIYNLSKIESVWNYKHTFVIALICAILPLFRSEFIVFNLFLAFYMVYRKKWLNALLIALFSILALLPWQLRNYYTFNKIIPLTSASGINLYRGNNPYYDAFWEDDKIAITLKEIPMNKNFEIARDSVFMSEALKSIKSKGISGNLLNIITKEFHLWVGNPFDRKNSNIFYYIPWMLALVLLIIGVVKNFSFNKYQYFYLFMIYHSLIAAIFFVIQRYQTLMKPLLLPFISLGAIYFYDKYLQFKRKSKIS